LEAAVKVQEAGETLPPSTMQPFDDGSTLLTRWLTEFKLQSQEIKFRGGL
jgi:hypothetical protein